MRNYSGWTRRRSLVSQQTARAGQTGEMCATPFLMFLVSFLLCVCSVIQSQITRSLELNSPAGQKCPALDLRMFEVHKKAAQGRSTVPLPVAKSTHELFRQMQAHQQKQQAQQNQSRGNAPAPGAAGAAAPPSSTHPDRKRARSPANADGGSKRDVVVIDADHKQPRPARSPQRVAVPFVTDPSYVPLERVPSPFIDAQSRAQPANWLPDLRRYLHTHPHHREHKSPHKQQHKKDDKDRGNRHDRDAHKRAADQAASSSRHQQQPHPAEAGSMKSPRGRRSQRRSNSRDRVNVQRAASEAAAAAASSSSAPAAALPSGSPLEEGELRVAPSAQLTSIAEESESNKSDVAMSAVDDESRMLLSPRAQLARSSTALTKSCSSLTLASLSVSAAGRLHTSASMSNLQSSAVSTAAASAAATDILSGDILRMSSSHSPADPTLAMSLGMGLGGAVTTVNEEDIMREINRGAKELGAAAAEEEDEEEGHAGGEADIGRKAKRARIGSRPSSPAPANNEFEGTHAKSDTTVAPAAVSPARATVSAPVFVSSEAAALVPASSESSSSATLTTASSSASTATAPFSRQPSLADSDAPMAAEADEHKRMEDAVESKVIELQSSSKDEARMPSAKTSPMHPTAAAEAATVAAAPLIAIAPAIDVSVSKPLVTELVLPNGHGVVQPEDEQKSATAMEIAQ